MSFILSVNVIVSLMALGSCISAEGFVPQLRAYRAHPILRIGVGFFLMTLWFGAMWKILPMHLVWAAGIALLAPFLVHRILALRKIHGALSGLAKEYLTPLIALFLLANLFLLPVYFSPAKGPFTEGGGDSSIYCETAKVLTDGKQPCYGFRDLLFDWTSQIKNPKQGVIANPNGFQEFDPRRGNPPAAEFGGYRVAIEQGKSSFQFSGIAQWFFLQRSDNYAVYTAILCFLYALMLGCFWAFLRRFGVAPASLAIALALASYGLVSVGYNAYLLQFLSLAASALFLGLLTAIPPLSRTGLLSFVPALAVVGAAYSHFLFVLVPLPLFGIFLHVQPASSADSPRESSPPAGWRRAASNILLVVAALALVFLLLPDMWAFIGSQLERLSALVGTGSKESWLAKGRVYMGNPLSATSASWYHFLLGIHSQQHLSSFVVRPPFLDRAASLNLAALLVLSAFSLGAWAWMLRPSVPKSLNPLDSRLRWFFPWLLLAIALSLFVGQDSLYSQAKSAQNTLFLVFAALILPPVQFFATLRPPRKHRATALFLLAWLATIGFFLVPRIYFTRSLARDENRAAVVDQSLGAEALKIRARGEHAFVLFEPRKSADLYLSTEPFFGLQFLATRHLALRTLKVIAGYPEHNPGKRFIPGDPKGEIYLYKDRDLTAFDLFPTNAKALWLVSATPPPGAPAPLRRTHWQAQALSDPPAPRLLFAGWDYEVHFGPRFLSSRSNTNEQGLFTYVRNGGAQLLMPGHLAARILAVVEPRDSGDFVRMLKAFHGRQIRGELASGLRMSEDGLRLRLEIPCPPRPEAFLIPLFQDEGEFWFHAQIDGQQL